jgi:hypothetical protein
MMDRRDEFLAGILDAAASTHKREAKLRRITLDLRTRVAKLTGVDFRPFIVSCNKSVYLKHLV